MPDDYHRLQGAAAMFAEKFNIMRRETIADGGGGFANEWSDGSGFYGAINSGSSSETHSGEAQDVDAVFTLAIPLAVAVNFGDYVKRQKDNSYYRIISRSEDRQTHEKFPISETQLTMKKTTLPDTGDYAEDEHYETITKSPV